MSETGIHRSPTKSGSIRRSPSISDAVHRNLLESDAVHRNPLTFPVPSILLLSTVGFCSPFPRAHLSCSGTTPMSLSEM
ncbi:hypothetical protein BD311DRAFT_768778 [Dichomitus squalens]|uniref:Uncharacterized protein n=1 Tax=Dichomitus squalens TaxID=114155 RepID=A0A4Q9M8A0_9APHY|nr:hypothetical protein BD311DRAFT_768778 [Dichomitus squalens]